MTKCVGSMKTPLALIALLVLIDVVVSSNGWAAPATESNTNWSVLGGSSDNQHFSSLVQISDKTVAKLSLAWYADIPTRDGLVGEPLVSDGVIYESGTPGIVWAHDLRTGKLLWTFDAGVKFSGQYIPSWGSRLNRGLALWKDKVYLATGDCRLLAIKRQTGELAWTADVCVGDEAMTITGAPRVGGGKIFVGPANADNGNRRGVVDAYDAENGRRLWRFYTIPGDPSKGFESKELEAASKTWGKNYWKISGSGSVWDGIQYDAKLHLLYLGVSSAMPEAPIDRGIGRGDELFSASIVAVNADTGKYVWHFKQTPDNAWNFDATSPFTIADLPIDGKQRRVLIQAPKNAFIYVIDAASGKFISGDKYGIRMNWASGLDPRTGRPIELPDARYYDNAKQEATHYPGIAGARSWIQMAFSQATRLSYIPAVDMATRSTHKMVGTQDPNAPGFNIASGATTSWLEEEILIADASAYLVAWDPVARGVRWRIKESLPTFGGVLATAGNLVFSAHGRLLRAFAANSGAILWSYQMPGGMLAPPVTVNVDGEQVLLCTIGNNGTSGLATGMASYSGDAAVRNAPARLLAFKIGGKANLPETNLADVYPRPPLQRFPKEVVERGRLAMMEAGCAYCHGGDNLDATGSVPNLKKEGAATHAAFKAIVIGGQRKALGMPDFSYLDPKVVDDIQAYIIDLAWDAYNKQEKSK